MSCRNLTITPVLSAVVVSAEMLCMCWVHKLCSGITKWLVEDLNYICPRCKGGPRSIDDRTVTEVDVDGTMIDFEATFYNLGDILCSGGGCCSAICWQMIYGPTLTSRHLSPRIPGNVSKAWIRSAMLHGYMGKGTRIAAAPLERQCRDPLGL